MDVNDLIMISVDDHIVEPPEMYDNHLTQVGVHRIIRLFDPVFRRISNPRASN